MDSRTWHMSWCFFTTTVVFLLSLTKEDVFVLRLNVLPDPTDLCKNKNNIVVAKECLSLKGLRTISKVISYKNLILINMKTQIFPSKVAEDFNSG